MDMWSIWLYSMMCYYMLYYIMAYHDMTKPGCCKRPAQAAALPAPDSQSSELKPANPKPLNP